MTTVSVNVHVNLDEVFEEAGERQCCRSLARVFGLSAADTRHVETMYYAAIASGGQQNAPQSLRDFFWHSIGRIL